MPNGTLLAFSVDPLTNELLVGAETVAYGGNRAIVQMPGILGPSLPEEGATYSHTGVLAGRNFLASGFIDNQPAYFERSFDNTEHAQVLNVEKVGLRNAITADFVMDLNLFTQAFGDRPEARVQVARAYADYAVNMADGGVATGGGSIRQIMLIGLSVAHKIAVWVQADTSFVVTSWVVDTYSSGAATLFTDSYIGTKTITTTPMAWVDGQTYSLGEPVVFNQSMFVEAGTTGVGHSALHPQAFCVADDSQDPDTEFGAGGGALITRYAPPDYTNIQSPILPVCPFSTRTPGSFFVSIPKTRANPKDCWVAYFKNGVVLQLDQLKDQLQFEEEVTGYEEVRSNG
jgi:hypothetical protein